ncbi:hypothetical protein [Streptomyces acidiscabies]|uniref:HTH luxR-type domain-containing protein n=1 Tax=Streptomyces acidiscabies TaxID=42234 RepID=A0ABU4LZ94_9ACTN|nr:hypothetical protein [Streptomyces acidiscabies]MDX3020871.1 hypothetical protein [Streptomyces acidiscabies]
MHELKNRDERGSYRLSEAALRLYGRLSAGEHDVDPGNRELVELARYGLIRPGRFKNDTYVAVPPWEAEADLLRAEWARVQQSMSRIGEIPALLGAAADAFTAAAYHTSARTRIIESREEVNAEIERAFGGARDEVITAQPGSRTETAMSVAIARDAELLERGVAMRTLYHPSSRANVYVQQYVKEITALGSQVRTLGRGFPRMILVDQRDAFFAISLPGAPEHGAVHTTDPAVVAWMRKLFTDSFWPLGDPWASLTSSSVSPVGEIELTVLGLLAEGYPLKIIGPRVGLSKSALNRLLVELKKEYGVESLFQLGVKYGEERRLS